IAIEQHVQDWACPMDEAPILCLNIRDGSLERAGPERDQNEALGLQEELIGGDEGTHCRVVRKYAAVDHAETLPRLVLNQGWREVRRSRRGRAGNVLQLEVQFGWLVSRIDARSLCLPAFEEIGSPRDQQSQPITGYLKR